MIARNYIKYPEALRFQVEMFSNGYHNSPRIMRLMECIFDFAATVPAWVKEAAARAKALVKRWKAAQVLLNFKAKANKDWTPDMQMQLLETTRDEQDREAFDNYSHSTRWMPNLTVEYEDEDGADVEEGYGEPFLTGAGRYMSYCKRHQGGHQGWAGKKHRKNRYNG